MAAQAAITVTYNDAPGGIVVTVSGQFNPSIAPSPTGSNHAAGFSLASLTTTNGQVQIDDDANANPDGSLYEFGSVTDDNPSMTLSALIGAHTSGPATLVLVNEDLNDVALSADRIGTGAGTDSVFTVAGSSFASEGITNGQSRTFTAGGDTITFRTVPEPSSTLLLGLAGLAAVARRRR